VLDGLRRMMIEEFEGMVGGGNMKRGNDRDIDQLQGQREP
jgi:hypothetical protein